MSDHKLMQVQTAVNRIIKGKEDVVEKVLAAIIGGGHILMEDITGVRKTTLATTFAKVLSLDCSPQRSARFLHVPQSERGI